jgi:hypothetical protein
MILLSYEYLHSKNTYTIYDRKYISDEFLKPVLRYDPCSQQQL